MVVQRIGLAWIALLGVALLWSAASPESSRKRFTLVYNVNNGGYVDVCGCVHKEVRQGSLTRRASFLKQLRGTGRELVLLDGGSALFPIEDRVRDDEIPEKMRQAELIVEAYNRMGYQALAIGPFDIAAGIDNLKKLQEKARFPFLSANLVDAATEKPIFSPHLILEAGGARVGVIGLTQSSMGAYFLEKVARGARVIDPVRAAKASLDRLRGQVDIVIALAHLSEEETRELLKQLPDIEIVVDPSIQMKSHRSWIREEEWVSFLGESLLLRSDGQGARLGVVDIEVVSSRGKLAAEKASLAGKNPFHFWRISLEPHHGRDAEIDRLVAAWKAGSDLSKVPRATNPLSEKADFLTVEVCKNCHEKQYENWRRTKHSDALTTLAQEGNETAFDCIGCHSLGYGRAYLDPSEASLFPHVQCESCHGTNPEHPKDPERRRFPPVSEATCMNCHNKELLGAEKEFFPAREMPKVRCPNS